LNEHHARGVVVACRLGVRRAIPALQQIGPTRTPYYNVLAMKTDDPIVALDAIERLTEERPALYGAIARVAPAGVTFECQSPKEFTKSGKIHLL